MLEVTHDKKKKGRDQNPNSKKGKNIKNKFVDMPNTMENKVVHGEITIIEIREYLKIFEQKTEEINNINGWMGDLS